MGGLQDHLGESENDRKYLEMMTSILETDVVGFAVLDAGGKYTVFNRGAEKLTGYDREEVIGKLPPDGMFSDKDTCQILEAMERSLPVKNIEVTVTRKDGSGTNLIFSMSPGKDESPENIHYIQIFLDNSEKKHLQRLLMHSQKMETIGEMAGGIAHDFNNLLEGVLGYTTFMMDLIENEHELYNYLEIIKKSAKKAADLTNRLLALSRSRNNSKSQLNCNNMLRDVTKLLERTIDKKISLELNLEKDLRAIKGELTQLESALLNICFNARDAMPGGGKLIISSDNVLIDETYPRLSLKMEPGNYVKIAISDTGIGMDEETVEKIFEPFFTTKKRGEGTGLGLNMVYGIIDNHGGFINVYSEMGKGTTFNIYLKAEENEAPEQDEERDETPFERGNGETVLIIDDEPMVLDIGYEMLEKLGYKAMTAGEASRGMKYFKERQKDIDIVLLDIIMPGVDGKEVLREIRVIRPDVPVILSSGYDKSVLTGELSIDDCTTFMQKPYSMEDLGRALHNALGKSREN
ncbi:MAG: response regulator [Candidatus Krumholzibacteria bacterium]|nr:response regulator [Candidatus Krumholzibacteria bacterium]